jgi:hypothetical protein
MTDLKGIDMSKGYNTNLAAEFYVLSMLHRLKADANLTLGNKKSVDIAVIHDAGDSVTVDVKGLAGKTSWPVDNFTVKPKHFLVLVCFLGKIDDPSVPPEVYVLPASRAHAITYNAPGGRRVIPLSRARSKGKRFKDAWNLLL